jgi:hypothetical protein
MEINTPMTKLIKIASLIYLLFANSLVFGQNCLVNEGFESINYTTCGGTPDLQINGSQTFGITQVAAIGTGFVGFHSGNSLVTGNPTTPYEYISLPLTSPMTVGVNYDLSFYQAIATLNGVTHAPWVVNNLGNNPGVIKIWAGYSSCGTNELIYTSSVVPNEAAGWVFETGNYTASNPYTHLTIIPLGTNTGSVIPYVLMDELLLCESLLPNQCDTICGPNLAPNPGFENTTASCANTISEMFTNYSQVQEWYGIACDTCAGNGSTPDYNNSNCSGPAQTNTCDGSNGSVGFFSFALIGSNAREYVQAQLTTPLTAGTAYCVSVEAKSATGSTAYERTDGLGIWFTNQMVDIDVQNGGQQFIGPGSLINASPQVENPPGNIIDTVCQTVSGIFTATGTEQWLVIGNFRNDVSTNSAGDCSFFCVGYMNIDNISIRESCNNTILPIVLNSFEVTCNNGFTEIKWTTSAEINNDYFTIEKSADALNWEIVTYIQGAGNSNQQINYSYIDDSYYNNNQTTYYRLKQTDFDGKLEYFNIVPIQCRGATSLIIFPNPATSIITISGKEINKIEIIDLLGRIVKQVEQNENNIKIDISNLSNGSYLVRIYGINHTSIHKLIKK